MNKSQKTSIVIALLALFVAFSSPGKEAFAQEPGRRHHGPPPEAYTVCEDKSEGEAAEFVTPHGDTVTGTCELENDQLVLRPDNPPDHRARNNTDE